MNEQTNTQWEYRLIEARHGIVETGSGFVMVKDRNGNSYAWAVEASRPMRMGYFTVMGWGHTPEDALVSAKRQACEAALPGYDVNETGIPLREGEGG